ncbi:MAG: hypothetical protein LBF56_03190 [Holosporales bacterium]|nr:hypothetical protein [Holosporales bacterium]
MKTRTGPVILVLAMFATGSAQAGWFGGSSDEKEATKDKDNEEQKKDETPGSEDVSANEETVTPSNEPTVEPTVTMPESPKEEPPIVAPEQTAEKATSAIEELPQQPVPEKAP